MLILNQSIVIPLTAFVTPLITTRNMVKITFKTVQNKVC